MSKHHRPESSPKPHIRHRPILNVEDQANLHAQGRKKSISSSLDSIQISPRTMTRSRRFSDATERDEVQLSLLSQEHDSTHDNGVSFDGDYKKTKTISVRDRKAMILLIVLCPSAPSHPLLCSSLLLDLIQGVPVSNTRLWQSHANPDICSWALRSVCTPFRFNSSSNASAFEAPYRSFCGNIYLIPNSECLLFPITRIL